MSYVTVLGGGLAGSEAAWQLAERGVKVRLWEMRPNRSTPAHSTGDFAELVCSNTFRSDALDHPVGLLKEEMRRLGSLVIACAERHRIPGGTALTLDREGFSGDVTRSLAGHPNIEVVRQEAVDIPAGPAIIATGPLTSPELHRAITAFTGEGELAYWDAASPIVTEESVDWSRVYFGSRYGKGEADAFANCPLSEEEYLLFWQALAGAEGHPRESFEDERYFEACLPVEVLAGRGRDTLRFGPMRPVGLRHPETGRPPYAVLQLRRENAGGSLWNLVGCQTGLRFREQERVFRLIPALAHAEFERYGVIHRNTFLKSPLVLRSTLQTRRRPDLFFAGQIIGSEGYVEAAAGGLVAGVNMARLLAGEEPLLWPATMAIGGLMRYVATSDAAAFQPMHVAFGLMDPLQEPPRRKERRKAEMSARALRGLEAFAAAQGLTLRPGARGQADGGAPKGGESGTGVTGE